METASASEGDREGAACTGRCGHMPGTFSTSGSTRRSANCATARDSTASVRELLITPVDSCSRILKAIPQPRAVDSAKLAGETRSYSPPVGHPVSGARRSIPLYSVPSTMEPEGIAPDKMISRPTRRDSFAASASFSPATASGRSSAGLHDLSRTHARK
jgi:hypothetical protein